MYYQTIFLMQITKALFRATLTGGPSTTFFQPLIKSKSELIVFNISTPQSSPARMLSRYL